MKMDRMPGVIAVLSLVEGFKLEAPVFTVDELRSHFFDEGRAAMHSIAARPFCSLGCLIFRTLCGGVNKMEQSR